MPIHPNGLTDIHEAIGSRAWTAILPLIAASWTVNAEPSNATSPTPDSLSDHGAAHRLALVQNMIGLSSDIPTPDRPFPLDTRKTTTTDSVSRRPDNGTRAHDRATPRPVQGHLPARGGIPRPTIGPPEAQRAPALSTPFRPLSAGTSETGAIDSLRRHARDETEARDSARVQPVPGLLPARSRAPALSIGQKMVLLGPDVPTSHLHFWEGMRETGTLGAPSAFGWRSEGEGTSAYTAGQAAGLVASALMLGGSAYRSAVQGIGRSSKAVKDQGAIASMGPIRLTGNVGIRRAAYWPGFRTSGRLAIETRRNTGFTNVLAFDPAFKPTNTKPFLGLIQDASWRLPHFHVWNYPHHIGLPQIAASAAVIWNAHRLNSPSSDLGYFRDPAFEHAWSFSALGVSGPSDTFGGFEYSSVGSLRYSGTNGIGGFNGPEPVSNHYPGTGTVPYTESNEPIEFTIHINGAEP